MASPIQPEAVHPSSCFRLFNFMHRKLEIIPPSMPNFFCYRMPPGKREDGFKGTQSIPIEDLTEEEALEFADMMRDEFLKHWKNKKCV